ncbi:MAG: FliM/FliN family flagellar motor C-terminal domain-containing protein [Sulfitobacter sp.]
MGQDPQDQTSDKTPDHKQAGSALLLKAQAGRQDHQSRTMSLPKALRLTMAKVADDLLDMAMAVIGARMESRSGEDLVDLFAADQLMILLDGPSRRRGAVLLDHGIVGGLLQQQTIGNVGPVEDGDIRAMTATDAAVCAPFLDALLSRAATLPDDPNEKALIEGYRFGARVADARLLMMALEEAQYQIVHLTVDVAGGKRQGTMMLCLPVISAQDMADGSGVPVSGKPKEVPVPALLDKNVLALNLELNVALTRLKMPLGKVQGLAVGDVVDLGVSAFDRASVQTRDGRRLSRGVLGQIDGVRALQMEHATVAQREPRRRAEDRDGLNLPEVVGDGTGTRKAESDWDQDKADDAETSAYEALAQVHGESAPAAMPDMSDLPGFADDEDLPRLEAG